MRGEAIKLSVIQAITKVDGSCVCGTRGAMDRDIRASIAAALDSRRAQREPIGRLQAAWLTLMDGVETLVSTLGETGMRFVALRQPTAEQALVAREIEAEPSAEEIRGLRQAIAA